MKFKTRDIQNWIKTMKIRKRKSDFFFFFFFENDYVLLNIFVIMLYKKNSLFNEKPFSNKFIFNAFDAHQKSSDI